MRLDACSFSGSLRSHTGAKLSATCHNDRDAPRWASAMAVDGPYRMCRWCTGSPSQRKDQVRVRAIALAAVKIGGTLHARRLWLASTVSGFVLQDGSTQSLRRRANLQRQASSCKPLRRPVGRTAKSWRYVGCVKGWRSIRGHGVLACAFMLMPSRAHEAAGCAAAEDVERVGGKVACNCRGCACIWQLRRMAASIPEFCCSPPYSHFYPTYRSYVAHPQASVGQ